MLGLLGSIVDSIVAIFNFIINTINSLITLISMIPTYTSYLLHSVAFVPDIVMPFVIASISFYVVLFILGRN